MLLLPRTVAIPKGEQRRPDWYALYLLAIYRIASHYKPSYDGNRSRRITHRLHLFLLNSFTIALQSHCKSLLVEILVEICLFWAPI